MHYRWVSVRHGPYRPSFHTMQEVLRQAVKRAAKVNAAANLGLHFVGVPGLPYLGEVQRAMNAIYKEDPPVLRARRTKELLSYGLTPEELQVFIQSARLLAHLHAHRPVTKILGGLRLPAAVSGDGGVIVFGAFDGVYWTAEVAGYEAALRAALPASGAPLELWLTDTLSPVARQQLTRLGWEVHDHAMESRMAEPGR